MQIYAFSSGSFNNCVHVCIVRALKLKPFFKDFQCKDLYWLIPLELYTRTYLYFVSIYVCMNLHELIHSQSSYYLPGDDGVMIVSFIEYVKSQLIGKDPDAGNNWRQEEKGTTENELVEWHHWLDGHEFEQAPGDSEGQGSLTCCSPRGSKELDMIEQLNSNNRLL